MDRDSVNREFEPTEVIETVLREVKKGRVNPMYLRERLDLDKTEVEYALRRLVDAGWVDRVAEGLYAFRVDPRDDDS